MISIIVPIYNAEQFLRECIDSILSQNYSNIEIILVNDGSRDGSLNLVCIRGIVPRLQFRPFYPRPPPVHR